MPRLDGTGPRGLGSSTGRGMGNCNQSTRIGRRGLGRRCNQAITKESLEKEKKALEERLELLNKELGK